MANGIAFVGESGTVPFCRITWEKCSALYLLSHKGKPFAWKLFLQVSEDSLIYKTRYRRCLVFFYTDGWELKGEWVLEGRVVN